MVRYPDNIEYETLMGLGTKQPRSQGFSPPFLSSAEKSPGNEVGD